jgi:predicted Ser/Thr protein kinase
MTNNSYKDSPAKILARAFFNKSVVPGKYIGGGVNGKVYATNNNHVIKFILGDHPEEYEALKILQSTHAVPSFKNRNGKVMKLTPKLKLAAKEMFGNTNNHMTAIIMGKVGGANPMTLKQYVAMYPGVNKENINRRVRIILDHMGSKGISHGNFHAQNIIVEVSPNGKIVRMWVIDFGRAFLLPLNMTSINLLKHVSEKTQPTRSLYQNNRFLEVPVIGGNHRINQQMAQALLGTKYLENNIYRISNLRKFVHKEVARLPNSPRRVATPTRRTKSVSPARRVATPTRRTKSVSSRTGKI